MATPRENRFAPQFPFNFALLDDDNRLVVVTDAGAPINVVVPEPLDVNIAGQDSDFDVNVTNSNLDVLREYTTATLTIAQNASVSDAFDMRAYAGGYLITPNSLQGIIHFQVSADNVTFYPLDDEFNAPITITTSNPATEAKAMNIPAKLFAGFYVKVATYTTAVRTSAQVQSAARTIGVILKS